MLNWNYKFKQMRKVNGNQNVKKVNKGIKSNWNRFRLKIDNWLKKNWKQNNCNKALNRNYFWLMDYKAKVKF